MINTLLLQNSYMLSGRLYPYAFLCGVLIGLCIITVMYIKEKSSR